MQKKITHFLLILLVTATHLAQAQTPNTEKQKVIDFGKSGKTTEKEAIETDGYDGNCNVVWGRCYFNAVRYSEHQLRAAAANEPNGRNWRRRNR